MNTGRVPGIIALCLALAGVWLIAGHHSWFATVDEEVPTRLIPGASVSGTLKTSSRYQFELKSNEFFSLSIQKLGTDIELAVFGPDGKEIRTVACSHDGPIRVSEIVSRPGQHTARLNNCDHDGPGVSFELTLSLPSVASNQDQLRIAAERASSEAEMSAAQYQSGSRRTATEQYEDAIQKWITAGDLVEEFRARTNLAKLYSESGNWERASSASENALRRARSIKDEPSEVGALMALGAIQLNRGNVKDALDTAQKALKISRSLPSRSQEAEVDFLLGKIYFAMDSEEAPVALKDAQRIFEDLTNRDGFARSMIYLAAIDTNLNRYDIAIDSSQKALAVFRSLDDRQNEGLILILLGNIQFRMGRTQEALTFYGQAESIVGDSGDLFAEGTLVGGIAEAHLNLGQKETAREFFARALEKYQALHDRISIAWMLTALGRCTSEIGDTKAALGYLKLAREAFQQVPDKTSEGWVLNEMGLVYETMGETQNALAHMKQALSLNRSSPKPDPRLDAKALSGIGRFYETKDNLNLMKAMENYKDALHLYETAQDRFGRLNTIYRISTILQREGRFKEALVHQEGAIQEIEKIRTGVANSNLRTSFFATARQQYDLYIDTLMHLQREIDAFAASEKSRARTLVDMIAETSLALSDGVDPGLLDSKATRIAELDKLSQQLQTLINANDDPKAIEKLNGEIIKEKALLDDLDGRIRLQSPKYAAYVQPGAVTLAEVKSELGDSVMLEYVLGEDNSYLFAITQKDFKSYRLPGKSEIESRVRTFRDLIMTPPSPLGGLRARAEARAKYEKAANELGAVLIGPAAGLLGDHRLVIVPDGILQALPFGALAIPRPAGSTFTPLALEHDIVNLASASALVASRRAAPRRNQPDKTIAVFADAIYQLTDSRFPIRPNVSISSGSAAIARVAATPAKAVQNSRSAPAAGSDAELPRLRYTQNEANAIFSFVSAADRLDATGWKATKAALQSPDLNRFKYIHIAAHSILNDSYPDLSSLVLSRWDIDGKPLDGAIRLRDVYNLKLSAELVVLSACDTGLGKEVRGEGLMSMVRAFMSIGTPRVLATLWKVDDEQTSAFMTEFYKQLLDKQRSPAVAIREAQRALLQKADTQSPYFWAGFQLHGDWR